MYWTREEKNSTRISHAAFLRSPSHVGNASIISPSETGSVNSGSVRVISDEAREYSYGLTAEQGWQNNNVAKQLH